MNNNTYSIILKSETGGIYASFLGYGQQIYRPLVASPASQCISSYITAENKDINIKNKEEKQYRYPRDLCVIQISCLQVVCIQGI